MNLTMLQELVGVPHGIGLYYTLTIELVWYLACAALFALGWLAATERLAWLALAGLAVVGVGGPIVLAAYAARHRQRWFPAWLVRLGVISYSVYLLHPPVLAVVAERGSATIQVLAALVLTVAVAAFTFRWIELPGQRLGGRLRHRNS